MESIPADRRRSLFKRVFDASPLLNTKFGPSFFLPLAFSLFSRSLSAPLSPPLLYGDHTYGSLFCYLIGLGFCQLKILRFVIAFPVFIRTVISV